VVFTAPGRDLGPLLRRFGAPNGSVLFPVGSAEHRRISALCRRAVAAFGLRDGTVHLEGFVTPSGYVLGEITCRPPGAAITELVQLQHGVDLWRAFLQASLGERVRVSPRRHADVWCQWWLPPAAGRVLRLASAEQLRAVPWVIRAEVSAAVGDKLGPADHSSAHVAMVVYRARSADEALRRADELAALADLSVSPSSSRDAHVG
jgi:hypothetical protein